MHPRESSFSSKIVDNLRGIACCGFSFGVEGTEVSVVVLGVVIRREFSGRSVALESVEFSETVSDVKFLEPEESVVFVGSSVGSSGGGGALIELL